MQSMMSKLLFLSAASALCACGTHNNGASSTQSVFGTDDRQGAAPWIPIGSFNGGTAFAVGPSTIMTAAHAAYGTYPMTVSMNDGGVYTVTGVVNKGADYQPGTLTIAQVGSDWAILSVSGTFSSWLRLSSNYQAGEQIQLAGYSQDRDGASVDPACSLESLSDNVTIAHDCGMTPGASGGPLFHWGTDDGTATADWYVVGIQSTQICDRDDGNCLYSGGWSADISNFAAGITSQVVSLVNAANQP